MSKIRLLAERFWEKVNKNGPISEVRPDLGPCWVWQAGKDKNGYGRIFYREINGPERCHRIAWFLYYGYFPDTIDHLCKNRACVNVAHLENVTRGENTRRGLGGCNNRDKTHCPKGHEYTEENTFRWRKASMNSRVCKTCYRERLPEKYRRRREQRKMNKLLTQSGDSDKLEEN